MLVRLTVAFFLLGLSCGLRGQENAGAGFAMSFDGVNDYAVLGNVYEDLELPLTISAWVFLDPGGLGTIFSSQDNSTIYNGFHFYIMQTAMVIEYGDGSGPPGYNYCKRGKAGPVHNIFGRWVHVAAIVREASDMDLFLNGVNIGGTYIGNSQLPMNSSVPSDSAKIGFRSAAGFLYHFQGIMDELRIWNRSLSEEEIREQMCRKLTGREPGLIGYWDFNDHNILADKSPNHFDGLVKGNPKRVFSGAPIGDNSVSLYTNDWHEKVLSLRDSLDKVSVVNVTGNPMGLHIYEVSEFPSQSGGLNLSILRKPYFGVFAARDDGDNFLDVNYTYNDDTVCKLFTRPDNSASSWNENAARLSHVSGRKEVIKELQDNGLKIDLGADEAPCSFVPRKLNPLRDTVGFEFSWQDGSGLSTFQVSDFGTYWLTVNDGCTGATDTVRITKVVVDSLAIPNVFTPNGDEFNARFEIDQRLTGSGLVIYNRWGKEVYQSSNYQNDWDGGDVPAGVYFYELSGAYCIDKKRGTLSILR